MSNSAHSRRDDQRVKTNLVLVHVLGRAALYSRGVEDGFRCYRHIARWYPIVCDSSLA